MALINPPTSLPSSTSKVNPETVAKAVDALLKWLKAKDKHQKPQLIDQDNFIYLILTLKKIPPSARTNPYKTILPHPLHTSSEELCLIIDDRSKNRLTSEAAKLKIKADNIPISKVIKLSKLKSDYRPFEAKRKLCNSFDIFFADKRIIPLLPKLLGKQFFKKKKIPVPIDLTHKNWKEQIENACGSALLYMRTGTCSVVKVARVSQGRDEVVENVVAAIDGIVDIVPKKWENVRSLHLKLLESLALPVYQSVPTMGLKIEGFKKKDDETEVEHSEGLESREEGGVEEKEKKLGKRKGSKKGRIHEVRYMDSNLDEILDDNQLGSDGEDSENDDLGGAEFSGKKRKKADKTKKELAPDVLNLEKQPKKSAKVKDIEAMKQKKGRMSSYNTGEEVADDEVVGDVSVSGGAKKKKSKIGKLESGEIKMKKKKSKGMQATK